MATNVGTVNVNLAYGRCKDCLHWVRPWPNTDVNKRACAALEDREGDDAIIDDDGTARPLYTGPDFGCIHYEEKP